MAERDAIGKSISKLVNPSVQAVEAELEKMSTRTSNNNVAASPLNSRPITSWGMNAHREREDNAESDEDESGESIRQDMRRRMKQKRRPSCEYHQQQVSSLQHIVLPKMKHPPNPKLTPLKKMDGHVEVEVVPSSKASQVCLSGEVVIKIADFSFEPKHIVVRQGSNITFKVDADEPGYVEHHISSLPLNGSTSTVKFESEAMMAGECYTLHCTEAGRIAYGCTVYDDMEGSIEVILDPVRAPLPASTSASEQSSLSENSVGQEGVKQEDAAKQRSSWRKSKQKRGSNKRDKAKLTSSGNKVCPIAGSKAAPAAQAQAPTAQAQADNPVSESACAVESRPVSPANDDSAKLSEVLSVTTSAKEEQAKQKKQKDKGGCVIC
jgi:plastocyanin